MADGVLASLSLHNADALGAHFWQLSDEMRHDLTARYGLDVPWTQKILPLLYQYARFDFGESWFYGVPVRTLLAQKLPYSFALAISSTLLAWGLAFVSIKWRATRAVALALDALPAVIIATLVLWLGSAFLPWQGVVSVYHDTLDPMAKWADWAYHLVLPMTAAALTQAGFLTQLFYHAIQQERTEPYARYGIAQRLPTRPIKNALSLPCAHLPSAVVMLAIGGQLMIEAVFALDGVGMLALTAYQNRDYPLIFALAWLVSVSGVFLGVLSDFLHTKLDARVVFDG